MNKVLIIFIGIMLGIVSFFSIGAMLVLLLFSASIIWIKYCFKSKSTNFLLALFIIGFAIRLMLSAANYYLPLIFGIGGYEAADTQPDAITYNGYAAYVAETISDRDFSYHMRRDPWLNKVVNGARDRFKGEISQGYQTGKNVMSLGVFYAWIGYAPLTVKLINSILGCIIAIMAYCISRRLIDNERGAKIAAILTMFCPSLMYWSATLLQDTFYFFLFSVYIFNSLDFFIARKIRPLVLALVVSFVIYLFKPKFSLVIAACDALLVFILFYTLFIKKLNYTGKIIFFLCLGLILVVKMSLVQSVLLHVVRKTTLTHSGYAASSSIMSYHIYPERFYDISTISIRDILSFGYIFIVLKAVFYFIFSPFPWVLPTKNILIFYPQIIFSFLLIPFIVRGILIGLRYNFKPVAFTIVLVSLFLFPLALSSGLSGITFRHKDLFMPFIFIFASFGILVNEKKTVSGVKKNA